MKENNQMIPMTDSEAIVQGMRDTSSELYSSFDAVTSEDKIKLYNALSADGETVKSAINKKIAMVDCVILPVEVINEDGSKSTVPRVTILDKDGKGYTATSWGVYNSIKKISAIFGGLHFDVPMLIQPVEVKTKNGFTINLKVIG